MTPERGYRAILFDLFGTLVFFRRLPMVGSRAAGGVHRRLADAVARELAGVEMEEFLDATRAVGVELEQARRQTHREIASADRFRRILARLGHSDEGTALRLCAAHMGGLAEATEMPSDHAVWLGRLASRYRVGLISNFDDGPTARSILARHGLADLLDPIVISEECGWRKPGAEIFAIALDALGVPPERALFVGDTPLDDVVGAQRAGIDAVWLDPRGEGFPQLPGGEAPAFTAAGATDVIRALLA